MTVSEFYTYTFVVFDEIAYEWVQGSYVAFEIKIFDEDQEVIVFTVEFSVRESQTCDPLLLGKSADRFRMPTFVFFSAEPVFFGDRYRSCGRGDRSVSRNDGCCLGNDGCRILHFGMKQYLPGNAVFLLKSICILSFS